MYIFEGHLLDSDWYLVLDSATVDDSCIWRMVKLVNMFTTIYVYSLYGNININYGNYVLL